MFVQVIEGRVRDADAVRRQWQEWMAHLAPDAIGWVGSTGGITPEGRFVAAVRFESDEAAARNANRSEQDQWWAVTEKALEEVTFSESSDYVEWGPGGSDDAGFVQVMAGRITDRARYEELETALDDVLAEQRPDLLGGYQVWLPDDTFVAVNYFTSEDDARVGEAKHPPEEVAARLEEWRSLMADVRWLDLPEPWLHSAS